VVVLLGVGVVENQAAEGEVGVSGDGLGVVGKDVACELRLP
jgi:hypothetical protein